MTFPTSYYPTENLSDQVRSLICQQKKVWPLLRQNYAGLEKIESKIYSFNSFKVIAQYNPERIRSSAAKTDEASIRERPCFLCKKNRPKEQQGIDFQGRYTVLANPYPIFPEHLTIPLNEHLPQRIEPYFPDMLLLSRQLPGFTVFYNGPECGASAPDHFHFQAGTAGIMPADTEIEKILSLHGDLLFQDKQIMVRSVGTAYLRKFIVLSSASEEELTRCFAQILRILEERGEKDEPMMNIISAYQHERWGVIIFPRDKQRPWQFDEEGNRKIVMSPASVELGGLAVLPRKEDFDKLTKDDLASIYNQVTINDADFDLIKKRIKNCL
ncbi:MAG: DUF4922 domain-containing protein [Prolixibacteraceae bacterium]